VPLEVMGELLVQMCVVRAENVLAVSGQAWGVVEAALEVLVGAV
jgi:hypothetical protein